MAKDLKKELDKLTKTIKKETEVKSGKESKESKTGD